MREVEKSYNEKTYIKRWY